MHGGRFGGWRALACAAMLVLVLAADPILADHGGEGDVTPDHVVQVAPYYPAGGLSDLALVFPVTTADDADHYLFTVRVHVRQSDQWVAVPLDPADTFLELRTGPAPESGAPRYGGTGNAFAFAGDATRVLVTIPADERPSTPRVIEGQAAGHTGFYNSGMSGRPLDVQAALSLIPTPVLFDTRNMGTYKYSAQVEIAPTDTGYAVTVSPESPFVETTTLWTRDGSDVITLDRNAPAERHFTGNPVGVIAKVAGTRFTMESEATFGDPVPRLLVCRTVAPCASTITNVLTLDDVTADARASSSPSGEALTFHWDFGDGATATGVLAQHAWGTAGTYPVTLTVTDASGRSADLTVPLNVLNRAPEGTITVTPEPATRIAPVTARANGEDPDGSIVGYTWFLNGVPVQGPGPSGTLRIHPGTVGLGVHQLQVNMEDDHGYTGAALESFEVVNVPPVAKVAVPTPVVQPGTPLAFIDESRDPDGDIVARHWDFGDGATCVITGDSLPPACGATGTATHFQRAYPAEGAFTPTLTVIDSDGAEDTVTVPPVRVDGTLPDLTVIRPDAPASGWFGDPVRVRVDASDDVDPKPTVTATVNGQPRSVVQNAFTVTQDGENDVHVRVEDWAGNAREESFTIRVDRSLPRVSFVPPDPFASGVELLVIHGEETPSGIARLELTVDGAPVATHEGPGPLVTEWDTRDKIAGRSVVHVRVEDNAGNARGMSWNVPVLNVPGLSGSIFP